MEIFSCEITGGGGTKHDGGDFQVKETAKTLTFVCVRQPYSSNRMSGEKPVRISKFYPYKRKREDGTYEAFRKIEGEQADYIGYFNNGHVARKWEDRSWTVYPNQCGIHHYLEPKKEAP